MAARLVITNGMIWDATGPPFLGTLICNDRVVEVIAGAPDLSQFSGCQVVDARGGSVIPAFTDSHVHFSGLVRMMSAVDLTEAHSKEDLIALLLARSRERPPGDWLYGIKFNNSVWADPRLPTRDDLDVVPNPVLVQRICLHVITANSRAIALAGESSFDGIVGVVRDSSGRMTGVLQERASRPFETLLKDVTDSVADFRTMLQTCVRFGIGELHPIGVGVGLMAESLDWYRELRARGELPLRVRLFTDRIPEVIDDGDEWVSYGGFKTFIDGSLGGRTAAVRRPYLDVGTRGLLLMSDDELANLVREVNERGVQLMAHCIGDRALDQLLTALEHTTVKNRWPIKLTHVSICHPEQVARIVLCQ
jgi:predicted amidohydrolase YtcJ